MNFQYYHGTSDLFLDSIVHNGLGGINVNFENRHLATLQFLHELAEKHLTKDKRYLKLRDTTKAMAIQGILEIDQKGRKERLNFRHDGTYIALSEVRAISYACNNKYGSEIVTRAISLMALLEQYGVDYNNTALAIEQFQDFRKRTPRPIIVKILAVDEERLDKEDGKSAKEALTWLRTVYHTLTDKQKFEFFQYCNFKLLDPVPIENLEFFDVNYQGKLGNPDFKYELKKKKL